jgi:hypothetical protein
MSPPDHPIPASHLFRISIFPKFKTNPLVLKNKNASRQLPEDVLITVSPVFTRIITTED